MSVRWRVAALVLLPRVGHGLERAAAARPAPPTPGVGLRSSRADGALRTPSRSGAQCRCGCRPGPASPEADDGHGEAGRRPAVALDGDRAERGRQAARGEDAAPDPPREHRRGLLEGHRDGAVRGSRLRHVDPVPGKADGRSDVARGVARRQADVSGDGRRRWADEEAASVRHRPTDARASAHDDDALAGAAPGSDLASQPPAPAAAACLRQLVRSKPGSAAAAPRGR